ncbi:nucleotidyl transferase AbiEii/AbiGii toxin family protein [Sneathiella aquimaris]|uniref:nucleotidyl transferase AbiEii/AbiGii toxin family protein n=1 Tax=Sneathiella aquimaris TaxID=2599305 RepID=UPI00146BB60D|nr:nucleotidyl transferase AbiEii/AbiGii toxin family protein [Sneathiella aquimaris]
MAKQPKDIAASVRQRLLNLAREEQRVFEVVLVAFGLERLIYRLSVSDYRERFVLKGGMLVTLWTTDPGRFTRDVDFLGFGDDDEGQLKAVFAEILAMDVNDGLTFDSADISASDIREDQVYGGKRLKTTAYLGKIRIPITIDLGFGDTLGDPKFEIEYTSLLDFEAAKIRAYSPATVIAEKFQAVVDLGVVNGRMKDFYDLWAVPKAKEIPDNDLARALKSTFDRRHTEIPTDRPPGLSEEFATEPAKVTQWTAYAESTELEDVSLEAVVDEIWERLAPICLAASKLS